jgi:hypothetical protein
MPGPPLVDLKAIHAHGLGRSDAKANPFSLEVHDGHPNSIANDHFFIHPSRQN